MMEDFNIPSKERTILLETLQEVIGNVPPYFWAICHSTQGSSRISTPNTIQRKQGLGSSPGSPLAKKQKTTDSPASPPLAERQMTTKSPVSSPVLRRRSKVASDLARERDGHCCVLSGESVIEVAHIYPFCRLSTSEENVFGVRHMFWEYLKNLWSEETVAAWQAELFPRGLSETGDERVDNRITLSVTAHRQWNRGAFALKPISISDEDTTLKATMSLLTIPLSTEDLDHNDGAFDHGNTTLNCSGPKAIKSGQIFELKTTDPIEKPLPSFKFLELQWALTRVIGMSGAAFPYEPSSGDDSDEDVPGLDLDEVGGTPVFSDIPQTNPPELLHEVNKLLVKSLNHCTEEAEGDRVGMGSDYCRDNGHIHLGNRSSH
ncbi:hypothetical protein SBOR_4202 [Sclerotinia borealis F-4128]|uniref:HNH nuclease domain-containing protein n=1 Tax=Sclerotinia borealis (strain F-4128) TaxID=1432307 RepID=W9CF95_SCLBF|nr:hypothetical protein SBOR_4202 [Sclerotinia borealis F-4128]